MSNREPASAEPIAGATTPTAWSTMRGHLEESTATYWLATVRPSGTPHVMPVLAVWVDGCVYFCAGETTRKAKNLVLNPYCVVTVEVEALDLVMEGKAVKVRDGAMLRRVADAYASTYGWRVVVTEGAFHGTEGAPTAGPPPYDVYELTPTVAFGLGLDERFISTKWRFDE